MLKCFVFAAIAVAATACGGGDPTPTGAPPVVVSVQGPRGLTVLFPPQSPAQPNYADVQTYLLHNPAAPISGANISVQWSAVDKGPTASPQYDWTSVDAAIAPWVAAGKKAYLTVSTVSYATGSASLAPLPAYMQSQATMITCAGSAPAFWQPSFYKNYQAFMAAVVQRYGANPSIGYIRFGLGVGGETGVIDGYAAATCQTQLTQAGFSTSVWIAYLEQMLDYEQSLHSARQLMVGINVPNTVKPDYSIPDAVAARAARDGIGIGSQGLQQADVANFSAGQPCTVDWCAVFNQYAGQVPLELQTVDFSDPTGSGMVGSLATLIPFGVQRHAQNFEIYVQDWLIAFDPNYPGYAQYHDAYQQALIAAAAQVSAADMGPVNARR